MSAETAGFPWQGRFPKNPLPVLTLLFGIATSVTAQTSIDRVAGIQLYPGGSSNNVEGSEKVIKDTGYATAVCRHTGDSLAKVVAFYRNDKQLSLLGEPSSDNAGFATKAGASMSINSPWLNMKTLQFNNGTMICIADRGRK
ncbi:MAG: hypothetical protein H7Y61_16825 [Rhizobiales bacterium]|nr:hypothetical protein [Rhizobacter sp.]